MVGARVHICPDDLMRDPPGLMREIERQGVTVLQVVPSLLREFLARAPDDPAFAALRRLRWLISTGEPLPPDLCRDWFRLFPNVRLMNAYGQTECSDDVATCSFAAPPASLTAVPIGKPILNTRLYVLDSHLQPAPIGVAGELYVGGIAVGRGYHDDPEQTGQRFLHDPFSKRRGARLYRTGDVARWRADGTVECLGRSDHQVKDPRLQGRASGDRARFDPTRGRAIRRRAGAERRERGDPTRRLCRRDARQAIRRRSASRFSRRPGFRPTWSRPGSFSSTACP